MRIAIIGASFAKAAYLPALRHVDGVEVVGIASARLESARAAAAAFDVRYASEDWRAMLGQTLPDLVCIATPTDTHAPMTLAAFAAGAHVLCEKPTAMNAEEAKQMRDAAAAANRIGAIDHELRFNPNRMKMRDLIRDGAIGRVRHLNVANYSASAANPASKGKDDWWMLDERGGGRLGANGSHQVDLIRFLLGEVAAVEGRIATMAPARRDPKTGESWTATADDVARFTLDMESGAIADVFISAVATNLGNSTKIFGETGALSLDDKDEKLTLVRQDGSSEDMSVADPNAALRGVGKGIWNVSVISLMRDLVAAIREQRAPAGATFEDGFRNQLVLDAVKQSSAERRTIRLG